MCDIYKIKTHFSSSFLISSSILFFIVSSTPESISSTELAARDSYREAMSAGTNPATMTNKQRIQNNKEKVRLWFSFYRRPWRRSRPRRRFGPFRCRRRRGGWEGRACGPAPAAGSDCPLAPPSSPYLLAGPLRRTAAAATGDWRILRFLGEDCVCRTQNWERKLRATIVNSATSGAIRVRAGSSNRTGRIGPTDLSLFFWGGCF